MAEDKTLHLRVEKIDPGTSFRIDVQNFETVIYQSPQLSPATEVMKVPITTSQMIEKFKSDG